MRTSDVTDAEIREILKDARTIAVVGLSDKPDRDSYRVAKYLIARGYRVLPVNPNVSEVLGEKSYPALADVPGAVDIVNVFRRPEALPEIVEQAIAVGARTVWMQEGVIHEAAAEKARSAGLRVVMDRCIKKKHSELCP